jgi:hypothetical protein
MAVQKIHAIRNLSKSAFVLIIESSSKLLTDVNEINLILSGYDNKQYAIT